MKPDDDAKGRVSNEAKMSNKDITPVLKGWEYEPGTINVRKVHGLDGLPKLQMRLDLGLLQMEIAGRPDGVRPHGCESLLEYYEHQLNGHKDRNGTELGFNLSAEQCQNLREEAVMYYHRYLSLFVLEDFEAVERDTARNLRVLDMCGKYAADEQDRMVMEQYRPYILMMHCRARAAKYYQQKDYPKAVAAVDEGLTDIREFFERFGQEEAYEESNEVRVLKRLLRDMRRKLPVDPAVRLQQQLAKAVKEERYEDAAKLRDQIARKTEPAE